MEKSEDEPETQNKSARLNHEWVQVLINLRMKYAKSFTGKRHSATTAWNDILQEMQNLGAPKSITRLRLKKKWMNLVTKYKQLKCDADSTKQNSWPYFEQIDRAYSKRQSETKDRCNGLVPFTRTSSADEDSKKFLEKEKFMRTLIDMRYKHRHLFTGKKYAAQKGWLVIQNYLPSGDRYTIDQISKIWHNLVQRYKALTENESDYSKISWIYFQQLHEIMSQDIDSDKQPCTTEFIDESITVSDGNKELYIDNENPFEDVTEIDAELTVMPFIGDNIAKKLNGQNEVIDELKVSIVDIIDPLKSVNMQECKSSTSLDDVMNYLKERDRKRDEQIKQIFDMMQEILLCLKE